MIKSSTFFGGENKGMHTKGGKLQWGGDGGVLNWAKGLICIH